jgi:hypothetical protein
MENKASARATPKEVALTSKVRRYLGVPIHKLGVTPAAST